MPRLEDFVNLSAAVYGNPPNPPPAEVIVPSSEQGVNETWTFLFGSGPTTQPGYYGAQRRKRCQEPLFELTAVS